MQKEKEMCVQCKCTKGNSERVLWADASKAIKGREVKIEESDGQWTTNWIVSEVYGPPLPKEIVQHQSHAHTRQRKCSDI